MASSSGHLKCAEVLTAANLCAYDLCEAIENLKLCARCKDTWYCCKEHQKQHWKVHKKSCKINHPQQERGGDLSIEKVHSEEKAVLSSQQPKSTPTTESNRDKSEVEPTKPSKVQEDIAQFSANIRRKHSCTLTPCNNGDDTREAEQESRLNQSTDNKSGKPGKTEQENMPPNQPAGVLNSNTQLDGSADALVLYVCEHMRKFGICVVDKFLKQENGDAILDEVRALRGNDAFHNGQLVTSPESGSTKDIRGDMITWTDGSDPTTQNIGFLISKIDSVVIQCKGHLEGFKNISGRTEAMVACYPGRGTHYVKHVDNPNADGRCVTCIYYLNKNWDSQVMGGSLRLYPRGHDMMANVDPIFNRLIFFWSDRRNPHEVMPAYETRYAITVWYFDAVERKKALDIASN